MLCRSHQAGPLGLGFSGSRVLAYGNGKESNLIGECNSAVLGRVTSCIAVVLG